MKGNGNGGNDKVCVVNELVNAGIGLCQVTSFNDWDLHVDIVLCRHYWTTVRKFTTAANEQQSVWICRWV